jgi:hypothetical protein
MEFPKKNNIWARSEQLRAETAQAGQVLPTGARDPNSNGPMGGLYRSATAEAEAVPSDDGQTIRTRLTAQGHRLRPVTRAGKTLTLDGSERCGAHREPMESGEIDDGRRRGP